MYVSAFVGRGPECVPGWHLYVPLCEACSCVRMEYGIRLPPAPPMEAVATGWVPSVPLTIGTKRNGMPGKPESCDSASGSRKDGLWG